ncbi:hypothetical protein DFJ74DRAFT_765736 [Hyaloraphidium curvatum]|nr:hypothetical protein DFJ74DRAFT_765736 [Hyaloraphidium curvatum]
MMGTGAAAGVGNPRRLLLAPPPTRFAGSCRPRALPRRPFSARASDRPKRVSPPRTRGNGRSAAAADREAALARFRDLVDKSRAKALGTSLSSTAEAVWESYSALGSAEDLAASDVDHVVFLVTHGAGRALESAHKEGDQLSRSRSRSLARTAVWRAEKIMRAAADAGMAPCTNSIHHYLRVRLPDLSNHAGCVQAIDFVRSCGGSLAQSQALLLRGLAEAGNYTAFLSLLHRVTAGEAVTMPHLVVFRFVEAIRNANRGSSEDLVGYPANRDALADLQWLAPGWKGPFFTGKPDPLEVADDPAAALESFVASQKAESIADLCRPGMEPGSVNRTRKVLQLFALVVRFSRARAAENAGPGALRINYGDLGAIITALVDGGHPRLARAALDMLLEDPLFLGSPNALNSSYAALIKDASMRGDVAAVGALEAELAARGVEPNDIVRAQLLRARALHGRTDLAKEQFAALKEQGKHTAPSVVLALLDSVVGPESTALEVKEAVRSFREAGVAFNRAVWWCAFRPLVRRGDVAAVADLWSAVPKEELEMVRLRPIINELFKGDKWAGAIFEVINQLPPSMLRMPWAWATLLEHFNYNLKRFEADGALDTVVAVCGAFFAGKAPEAADFPARATPAMVGIRPPRGRRGDNAVLHGYLHALGIVAQLPDGPKEEVEDLARQGMAGMGFEVAGMGAEEMQDAVAAGGRGQGGPERGGRRRSGD